jgi:hypothetical protein
MSTWEDGIFTNRVKVFGGVIEKAYEPIPKPSK